MISYWCFYLKTADISCIVIRSLSAHSAHQSQAVVTLPLSSSISATVCDCAASHTSSFVATARKCDLKSTSGARFMRQSASTWRGSMPFIEHSCTVESTRGTPHISIAVVKIYVFIKFDSLSTDELGIYYTSKYQNLDDYLL